MNATSHDILKVPLSRSKGNLASSRLSSESDSLVLHFEAIDKRLDNFIKSAKSMQNFLQKRVGLERDNIRSILKMAKSALEDTQFKKIEFAGIFDECWSNVRQNLEHETARRIDIIDNMEKRVISVLQKVLHGEMEASRRQLSIEGRKLIKDFNLYYQGYSKSSDRYRNTAAEWEGLLLNIYTDYGGIWSPTAGIKIWERESNTSRRLEEHKKEYVDHIDAINSATKSILLDNLQVIIKGMASIAGAMAQTLMSVFKHYSDFDLALSSTSIAPSYQSSYPSRKDRAAKNELCRGGPLQGIVEQSFDHKEFASIHLLGGVDLKEIPLPPTYRYDEYILCDEATQVLTQKVRHQCMDQMSTSEQATAIQAMMLTQKTSRPTGATPNKNSTNNLFITSCLEYLRNCGALKEEGLFRISGNASRITQLFQRSISDINPQDLQQEITMEVDMHTVGGAMKRHLRECSLLSSPESIELSRCLDYPMTEEKLHDLKLAIRRLPASKRELLIAIINFCNELVQNEPVNKMNAHAIGISLGLSLFPEMDTNHSTNLLKCLLMYQAETQPQMKSQYSLDQENTPPLPNEHGDDPFKDF